MAMGPPPHARCYFPDGPDQARLRPRDLRFPARRGPRQRNDHFSARRYSLRRLRPPALRVPASLAGRFPLWPARARPALRHPLCALRTTVPPPDTRAGVIPPAPVRAHAYPPAVALVGGTPLAVALVTATPPAVALVGRTPLAVAYVGRAGLAVAHAIPPAVALVGGTPLAVACVGRAGLAVAHAIPPAVACAVIKRTEVACAGAFPRPSRAPRILADPNRPAVLTRAHGAILKICYKIVNKLREYSDPVSWNHPHPHPHSPLSPWRDLLYRAAAFARSARPSSPASDLFVYLRIVSYLGAVPQPQC